jgi:tyrosinase
MDTRKNIYSLSDPALMAIQTAINALKVDGGYDDFVGRHFHGGHMIHRGPAFLPWHRYFIREFELALQTRVAGVVLPYWDWAADAPSPTGAALWNADPTQGRLYIGGDGDNTDGDLVKTGPFVNWTALIGEGSQLVPRQPPGLIRRLGRDPEGGGTPQFPLSAQTEQAMTISVYDSPPWDASASPSFRNRLEGWLTRAGEEGSQLHNRVHLWVGGDMLPHTSPNDPVFFLHHCNVDRLWARWQSMHPDVPYLPTTGGPPGHNRNDALPFLTTAGATPANSLNYQMNLGYAYDAL